ncbi:hypoxanthine phosphoribosyltransferase [uncultured Hymenobacter sp.]|uniref:hypoxanthine phosphoribosyltransferase n=1 Tax=uncultured Hymenobacter sp. TaxID=170016 RepID=UPI0035CB244B
MVQTVSLHEKEFTSYLPADELTAAVQAVAARINADYAGRCPLFVAVLNGAFMFAADLLKHVTVDCEIAFIRVASYEGTQSTGQLKELLGLHEDVRDRHVIILEDIVDTGHTMQALLTQLTEKAPASLEVATLFFKPASLQHELHLRYVGREIPNDFIVGYGLDYDGLGRNLPDVYVAV